jgi:hypothetical protein
VIFVHRIADQREIKGAGSTQHLFLGASAGLGRASIHVGVFEGGLEGGQRRELLKRGGDDPATRSSILTPGSLLLRAAHSERALAT